MEFKKGDICSIEVVVTQAKTGDNPAYVQTKTGDKFAVDVSDLTLIRRAHVDLATCEIPQEGLLVLAGSGDLVTMVGRDGDMAWLRYDMQSYDSRLVSDLRPPDVPTPATGACAAGVAPTSEGEAARLRARVAQLEQALRPFVQFFDDVRADQTPDWSSDKPDHWLVVSRNSGELTLGKFRTAAEALASTTPTCPPGHIMIGDRAVPEPMREAPAVGTKIWLAHPFCNDFAYQIAWTGHESEARDLSRGLCYSTEATARAVAQAMIAPTKREGV